MLENIITNYNNRKKLSNEEIQRLNKVKNHQHLIVRINKTNKVLEPFNTYITCCIGCELTNLYFCFHDSFSQAMQNIYLDAKTNNKNFQYLTNKYCIDFIDLQNKYNELINDGYSFEEIYFILRKIYNLNDEVGLKRTKKL